MNPNLQLAFSALAIGFCFAPAHAERISRVAPGTAPCGDDKAVRVLAIGGELQANSWCGKKVVHRDNTGKVIEAKTKQREREAYSKAKADERARRKHADEERAQASKEAREKAEAERKERESNKKLAEEKARREAEAKKAKEAEKERERVCRGVGKGADCKKENPGNHRQ